MPDGGQTLTARLLQEIGSPFESQKRFTTSSHEAHELYNLARVNKIGLLYLNTLAAESQLYKLGLEAEYQEELRNQYDQQITVKRTARILDSASAPYVVFKSIMPFPAVPNDVDILYLGSPDGYLKAANALSQSGYQEIKEGLVRYCILFHDMRVRPHGDTKGKDAFDVDLYEEVAAASHLIYLAKTKIRDHVTTTKVLDQDVMVFRREIELLGTIAHSIIEAQMYTLLIHYATLYHLAEMNLHETDRLIALAKENNLAFALRTHVSLVIRLEELAHRTIPDKLKRIQYKLGMNQKEARDLQKNHFTTPHHHSLVTIARVLAEKVQEREFARGAVRQTMSMLNPIETRRILRAVTERQRRGAY